MKKVLLFIVAALMALTLAASALATSPSKTVQDVLGVQDIVLVDENGNETPAPSTLVIRLIENQAQLDLIDEIETFTEENDVGEYFPQEAQQAYADAVHDVEMNELSGLQVSGYQSSYGDVAATFSFSTVYDAEQDVYPLIGVVDGDSVTWTALDDASVQDDGSLKLLLPGELLTQLNNSTNVIAILDTPLP